MQALFGTDAREVADGCRLIVGKGLVSRAGIIPLSFSRDRGGPLCRTVQDTAAVLEVVAGSDPRDEVTSAAYGRQPVAYRDFASRTSLAGKRLGVVRDFMIEASLADRDSICVANEALAKTPSALRERASTPHYEFERGKSALSVLI